MSHYTPAHRAPRPRRDTWTRAARRLRITARNLLWAVSDRLCSWPETGRPRRLAFEAGHWIGEAGWKLSGPFRLTPAPGAAPGQARDAGTATPAPAAAATIPSGGAATLPPPVPPREPPGRGQHLAWVITQPPPGSPLGYQPVPRYRGDYRPTQPMRALPAVSVVRPYYPAAEARRDSVARWGA